MNHTKYIILALAVTILFAGAGVASTTTVYVATDGTGDYNCDGTDDHIEINQALTYINSIGGGTVHLKSGTYIIDNSVIVLSNTILEGDGWSTLITVGDDGAVDWPQHRHMVISSDTTDIAVRNLKIDGKRDKYKEITGSEGWGAQYQRGIDLSWATNATLSGLWIGNNRCDAIKAARSTNITIQDCTLYSVGHDGIYFYRSDTAKMLNNHIVMRCNAGMRLYSINHVLIKGNLIHPQLDPVEGKGGHAIQIQWNIGEMDDILIEDNFIFASRGAGIATHPAEHATVPSSSGNIVVRNNVIFHCQWGGILLTDHNMLIEGNTIWNNQGDGIGVNTQYDSRMTASVTATVRNNIITKNTDYGLSTEASGTRSGPILIRGSYNNVWNNTDGNYEGDVDVTNGISVDPLFVNDSVPFAHANPEQLTVDLHLKSQYGRWTESGWVTDSETSPCIDAGDPADDYSNEPEPNGGRINIGAYGNTGEASKSAPTGPDITPPYTQGHSPAKDATGVAKDTNIVVHVKDAGEGVDQSSIVMTVEGVSVTPTITGAPADYTFTYNPPVDFVYDQVVNVTIDAQDSASPPNIMPQDSYSFTIQSEPAGELVGYWKFDEGAGNMAYDSSGKNNNGTLINMDPFTDWVDSKPGLGKALDFDGTDDYVDCGDDTSLRPTTAITIEAWVKSNSDTLPDSEKGHFVSKKSWDGYVLFQKSWGAVTVVIDADADGEVTGDNLTAGVWYHIAATYDGANVKLYQNGIYKGADPTTGNINNTSGTALVLGRNSPTGSGYFNGTIDEVRIYNRVLSAEEVLAHYQQSSEDTTLPARVTNLQTSNSTSNSITLTWTAPGDDGNTGTASQYDIRYSTSIINTEAKYNSASQAIGEPTPKPAGSSETFTVTGLSPNTTYYFALKTADEVPNWSLISNSPSGTTSITGQSKKLIPYIDLVKDVKDGGWEIKDGELISDDKWGARIELPYQSPDEYDCYISFTKLEPTERTGGELDGIDIYLPGDGSLVSWAIGGWQNTISGLELINGTNPSDDANPTKNYRPEGFLTIGVNHTAVVEVRNNSIMGYLDGELITSWTGNWEELSFPEWVSQTLLGIASYSPTVFHSIEVKEVTGQGTFIRFSINLDLEAKPIKGNRSAKVYIYSPGTDTLLYSQTTNLFTNSSDDLELDLSDFTENKNSNYDTLIKVPNYLDKKISNHNLVDNITGSQTLKIGDLDNDNDIDAQDWAVMLSKWGSNDANSDFNEDGLVNTIDFSFLNRNWLAIGD